MKYLLLCLILSVGAPPAKLVKYKGAKGYIFDAKYEYYRSIENQKQKYTPSEQDIHLAEDVLRAKIKQYNINQGQPNQSSTPVIHKHLNKYIRQYVGYITKNGEKVIWINCIWAKGKETEDMSKDIYEVSDGGGYFWNIEVNITKKSLSHLDVNGYA